MLQVTSFSELKGNQYYQDFILIIRKLCTYSGYNFSNNIVN